MSGTIPGYSPNVTSSKVASVYVADDGTVLASNNILSVVKGGAGIYVVNYTPGYFDGLNVVIPAGNTVAIPGIVVTMGLATDSCDVLVYDTNFVLTDISFTMVFSGS